MAVQTPSSMSSSAKLLGIGGVFVVDGMTLFFYTSKGVYDFFLTMALQYDIIIMEVQNMKEKRIKDAVLQIRLRQDLWGWFDGYVKRKRVTKTAFLTTILETLRMQDEGGFVENESSRLH